MKESGGARGAVKESVQVVRSSFIRKGNKEKMLMQKTLSVNIRRVNAGEDYDHHYRRKSR